MKRKKITLLDITKAFNLKVACGEEYLNREIEAGYASDLLSDVMNNTKKGDVWITRQIHPNIVAVGVLRMLSGIILINNLKPEEDTVKKAIIKNLPILTSELPAFELVGRLYQFGVSGIHK